MAAKDAQVFDSLERISSLIGALGYTLETEQPHIGGERTLMSASKLVLMAKDGSGKRVVVKVSNKAEGIREIQHDKEIRDLLAKLSFTNDEFLQPHECWYGSREGYTILITEFIEQEAIFVTRPLQDQFFILLRALQTQEAFHATTHGHAREVQKAFEVYSPERYLLTFHDYYETVAQKTPLPDLLEVMREAEIFLRTNLTTLARYTGYLTHNDFVPHNMRVRGRDLFILDQTSFWFGNKYEGWARLVNYMELHNPPLAEILLTYVRENRPAEYLSLKLMRMYKLGTLLRYYASILDKTEGDLRELTHDRLLFWGVVMKQVLHDENVPSAIVDTYKTARDRLRSDDEKARQREFAVA